MIATAIFLVLIIGCMHRSMATWTSYERDFSFECPSRQHVSSLKSRYNGKNDRKWEFGCTAGFVNEDCSWSSDQKEDGQGSSYGPFYCEGSPNDKKSIITGIKSRFLGSSGERIWNFKCCKRNTKPATDCKFEPEINQWGQAMDKNFPVDRAMISMAYFRPQNKQGQGDHLWDIKTCRYTRCTVNKLNILDRITGTNEGQKIIGIAVDQTCSSDTSTVKLYRTDTIEKTVGLSIGRGSEFNWGAEVTVGAEVTAGFLGSGATASMSVAVSAGGAVTAETVNTEETSVGSEDSAGKDLSYTGPGAAIIIGTVDKYKLNTDNINVEVISTCGDGSEWKERKKMNLFGTTYGKSFFASRRATYAPGKCGQSSEDCLRSVRGENAFDPAAVFRDFTQCIEGKGSVSRLGRTLASQA